LTLELGKHGAASAALTVVAVTLETGAGAAQYSEGIQVGLAGRTRVVVRPATPETFRGQMTLRSAGGPKLLLFREAEGGEGESLHEGVTFPAPNEPLSFWLQAESASAKAGDAMLQLGIEGVEGIGDWCLVTAVSIAVQAPGAGDGALLWGASAPVVVTAETTPAGVPVQWSLARAADDGEAVVAASPRALPTMAVDGASVAVSADAVGTFVVSASAAGSAGWGGPQGSCEVVMVRAALESNESTVNGRFARCAVDPVSKQFVLTSVRDASQEAPVQLRATIRLVGGGPSGERGVGGFLAGWAHRVSSDNTGARYKGGVTVGRSAPAVEPLSAMVASSGSSLRVETGLTPEISFPAASGDKPMEQLWSYLDCESSLVIRSESRPDAYFQVMSLAWSFTGDYTCAAGRVRAPLVAAKLAAGRPVIPPSLVPYTVD
jgi:hypothetical protein